jgi:putative membrane protein
VSRPHTIWTLDEGSQFWRDAIALVQTTALRVVPRTLLVGAWTLFVTAVGLGVAFSPQVPLLQIAPGLVLGLLLTQRTTASYQRWWEARQLWGGIVTQARNLAVAMVTYGPNDPERRRTFAAWLAAFAFAVRSSLRDEAEVPELPRLLGAVSAKRLAEAQLNLPNAIMLEVARQIRQANELCPPGQLPLLQFETCRARMAENAGGCDRIRRTVLPRVLVVTLRHLLVILLIVVPLVLAHYWSWWAVLHAMLLAYPVLAIDQIGAELERPFSPLSFSHLPLDQYCASLEKDLLAIGTVTDY